MCNNIIENMPTMKFMVTKHDIINLIAFAWHQ